MEYGSREDIQHGGGQGTAGYLGVIIDWFSFKFYLFLKYIVSIQPTEFQRHSTCTYCESFLSHLWPLSPSFPLHETSDLRVFCVCVFHREDACAFFLNHILCMQAFKHQLHIGYISFYALTLKLQPLSPCPMNASYLPSCYIILIGTYNVCVLLILFSVSLIEWSSMRVESLSSCFVYYYIPSLVSGINICWVNKQYTWSYWLYFILVFFTY